LLLPLSSVSVPFCFIEPCTAIRCHAPAISLRPAELKEAPRNADFVGAAPPRQSAGFGLALLTQVHRHARHHAGDCSSRPARGRGSSASAVTKRRLLRSSPRGSSLRHLVPCACARMKGESSGSRRRASRHSAWPGSRSLHDAVWKLGNESARCGRSCVFLISFTLRSPNRHSLLVSHYPTSSYGFSLLFLYLSFFELNLLSSVLLELSQHGGPRSRETG